MNRAFRSFGKKLLYALNFFLFAFASILATKVSADGGMPEGTKGWSYWRGATAAPGYAPNPVEACKKTAQNHMGTPLRDMRPTTANGLNFACKYHHFLEVGGEKWFGSTTFRCEAGYTAQPPGFCVRRVEPPLPPSCAGGAPGFTLGNPVTLSTGGKVQTEVDYSGTATGHLRVARTFRTFHQLWRNQSVGQFWSLSFDTVFAILSYLPAGRPAIIIGELGDGSYFHFYWNQYTGKYESKFDKSAKLEPLNSSFDDWLLIQNQRAFRLRKLTATADPDATDPTSRFRVVSVQTLDGRAENYSYYPTLLLKSVTDDQGRKLEFEWRGNVLQSVRTPSGTIDYSYTATSAEVFVFNSISRIDHRDRAGNHLGGKQYHYGGRFLLLSGITDENGERFATFDYDAQARAILSEHAGGADRYTFSYPNDQSRVVTDPLGTTRTIGLRYPGSIGLSTGESQPAGSGCSPGSSSITHDSSGNIASQTDFNGNKTCFVSDERGLEVGRVVGLSSNDVCPVSADAPLIVRSARRIASRWHSDYPIKTGVAAPRLITTHFYNGQLDADGRTITCAPEAKLPNGKPLPLLCGTTESETSDSTGSSGFNAQRLGSARIWSYTYDAAGRLVTVTGPTDSQGQAEFHSRTYYAETTATHAVGDLATVTNAAGEVSQYLEYSPDGLATKVRRPNGQTINLQYDSRQRLLGVKIEDTTGKTVRSDFAYDPAGNLVRSTAPDGSTMRYVYDAAHRLTGMNDGAGNTIRFELDKAGNVIRQDVTDPNGKLSSQVIRSFDALGRLQQEQSSIPGDSTSFQYDRNGNLTALIDQLGRATNNQHDRFDRVNRQLLPSPTATSSRPTIDFNYDQLDQLLGVTDPRQLKTSYTVNGFGQRISINSPDTGVSKTSFDNAGKPVASRDARGVTTTYLYDAVGRVTQAGSNSYRYGANGTTAAGQLTAMQDDSGQTTYAYDGFGRLLNKTQSVGSGAAAKRFALSFTYGTSDGNSGHVTSITYPSGNRVEIAYDSQGRASSLALAAPGVATPVRLLADIAYLPFGPVSGWTWGNRMAASPNIYERLFDLKGRLVSYPLGHPGANGVVRTLHYDAAGRITASRHTGNATASALDQQYAYDNLDRLTGFDSGTTSQRFSYDMNGNRTQARFGGTSYVNTISPVSNRLSATSGPAPAKNNGYDAAGNLLSDGAVKYTYGANGRMTSASAGGLTTGYSYNGLGQRVAKNGNAAVIAYYVYDEQGQLLGEYDASGKPIQETVYLGNLPVAVIAPPPQSGASLRIYYVYPDHLGTPRVLTRPSDNKMVWRWDKTDPFGLYQPDENPSGLGKFTYNLRFPGQIYDKETNNHYNYYRDYDPQAGRYVQSDPIGLMGGVNTYSFVKANPIKNIDPRGLLVTVILNRSNNSITVRDNNTGRTASASAFTGGHVNRFTGMITSPGSGPEVPAPPGSYYIVPNPNPRPAHDDWFGLFKIDDRIDDYFDDRGVERSGVRLHKGGLSYGCVTVNGYDPDGGSNWTEIRDIIMNTISGEVQYRTGPHWWNWTSTTTYYGILIIK